MAIQMFFNAFVLSFYFCRLSRASSRNALVLFSDRATITSGNFEFRVWDLSARRPLVEAHVRVYAVRHKLLTSSSEKIWEVLRIIRPNDELGGSLLLSLPDIVTHNIDEFSPLAPKIMENAKIGVSLKTSGLTLRTEDALHGCRDAVACPVCGETYGSVELLALHAKYTATTESGDGFDLHGKILDDVEALIDLKKDAAAHLGERVQETIREEGIEIVCVLEGIEPIMSGTFQAVQSYTYDEIVFGGTFLPCIERNDSKGGKTVANVNKFDEIAVVS